MTVRIQYRHINSKHVPAEEVATTNILEIPRQSLVAIHLPDMEKLKDMVIQQVNVYATPMVVGTYLYFYICTFAHFV